MNELTRKELLQEKPTDFHEQMLKDCRNLVNMSRRKMNEYYPLWDRNDEIYRSICAKDKTDTMAKERGEPEKMVVPISFAQIQTFIAFCFSLFFQRDRLFELDGYTAEDDRPAKIGEALLARDLAKNTIEARIFQHLLDIARFGMGIMKVSWSVEKQLVRTEVTTPPSTIFGVQFGQPKTEEVMEWATSYEGNRIVNISPYRFFPDVRMPLTRFQEGEFCASEEIYSDAQLKQWETEGVVAGVKFIKPLGRDLAIDRGYRWDNEMYPGDANTMGAGVKGDGQMKKTTIITEVQRAIIPSQYEIDGEPLGPEEYPVKYVIWIANDNRIIKCEPMNYLHNQFTYVMAPFICDNHKLVSEGLSDVIDQLQNVISWFINSRITNVRKVIGDKLIVNPSFVNMDDLQNRRPVIRLKAAATGDIDRAIKQLQLQDVTQSHIADVKNIHDILKMVTGITDTLLGEVRPGRRSATENRNTTSGSAARLKTIACIIFKNSLENMATQMLSNLRDGLEEATYVRVMGMKGQSVPEFVKVTKQDLVGHYAFEIFDGSLPSERYMSAQALEELIVPMIQNPQMGIALGLDVKKLIYEVLMLRGIRNPERFEIPQAQQQMMLAQQQQQQLTNESTNTASTSAGTAGQPGGPASGVPSSVPESILPLLAGQFGGGRNGGNGQGF